MMNKVQWYKIVDKSFPNNNERIIDSISFQKIPQIPYLEDQKVVLNGSEALEKLNIIIKSIDARSLKNSTSSNFEDSSNSCLFLKYCCNYKKIVIYYAKLKKLLIARYILSLKQECASCIKQNERFWRKTFSSTLFENKDEKKLLNSLPSKFVTPDCFIESGSIILMEQLRKMIQQWETLFLSFQKAATIFQTGFDIQFFNIFICTDFYLYNLYDHLIQFISAYLRVMTEKFSSTDLNNSITDFIPKVLEISEIFQVHALYQKCHRNGLHYSRFLTASLRASKMLEIQEFSGAYMLSFFGQLQACLAADRIIRVITMDMQNHLTSDKHVFNWLSFIPFESRYSEDTSDYCSGSTSEINGHNSQNFNMSHITVLPKNSTSAALISVINSLLQKNENFILKYLLTIKEQNATLSRSNLNVNVTQSDSNRASRKIWKFSAKTFKYRSCSDLKKAYWMKFWKKAHHHFIKLLIEVPYQQVGDYFSGSILACRDSFTLSLAKYLKDNVENCDYPDNIKSYLKSIHNHIFLFAAKAEWDKRFCTALMATHFSKCSAVLLENKTSGTFSGNALYIMLQPIIAVLRIYQPGLDEIIPFINTFHQLLSSMHYFQNWITIKEKICASSWNIQQFSLISCDIMRFLHFVNSFMPYENLMPRLDKQPMYLILSVENLLKDFVTIQLELKEFSHIMPQIMQRKAYVSSKDLILQVFLIPFWRSTICAIKSNCMYQIIEEILNPLCEINELSQDQLIVVKMVLTAIIQGYLDVSQKRKIRSSEVQSMIDDVGQLTAWVKRMNLFSNKDDKIQIFNLLDNLFRTLNSVTPSNFFNQRLVRSRNSVCPLMQPSEFLQ